MAGIPDATLLTLIEQVSMAKAYARKDVETSYRKLAKTYERNVVLLPPVEYEEARLKKRLQRTQRDWRRERRRCKKRGLHNAQKRVDKSKYEGRRVSAERFRLLNEIARAKSRHEFARESLDRAKAAERLADVLYRDDETRSIFLGSLQEIEALYERLAEDKYRLAEKAGVPEEYRDEATITRDEEGNTHFYFGGTGCPDGLDHAHYAMDTTSVVYYRRDPGKRHGSINYIPEYQILHVSVS